jgi:hypothetical protein
MVEACEKNFMAISLCKLWFDTYRSRKHFRSSQISSEIHIVVCIRIYVYMYIKNTLFLTNGESNNFRKFHLHSQRLLISSCSTSVTSTAIPYILYVPLVMNVPEARISQNLYFLEWFKNRKWPVSFVIICPHVTGLKPLDRFRSQSIWSYLHWSLSSNFLCSSSIILSTIFILNVTRISHVTPFLSCLNVIPIYCHSKSQNRLGRLSSRTARTLGS